MPLFVHFEGHGAARFKWMEMLAQGEFTGATQRLEDELWATVAKGRHPFAHGISAVDQPTREVLSRVPVYSFALFSIASKMTPD